MFQPLSKNNPSCDSGALVEDAEHFFLKSLLYNEPRDIMIHLISHVSPLLTIHIDLLLHGSSRLLLTQNQAVFRIIHQHTVCIFNKGTTVIRMTFFYMKVETQIIVKFTTAYTHSSMMHMRANVHHSNKFLSFYINHFSSVA